MHPQAERHGQQHGTAHNRQAGDHHSVEQTFDGLLDVLSNLADEKARAKREGLGEEALVIFDLLRMPDLSGAETRRIKQV